MKEERPAIPEGIKREVRQRCGFGCVVCGVPLYEYEHMEEWALVKRHVADEITLLCSKHHDEKTKGLLPIEDVRKFNANPFNLQNAVTTPYKLHYSGTECLLCIGGTTVVKPAFIPNSEVVALAIDGESLLSFRFEGGELLLNCSVYDDAGSLLLLIQNNELVLRPDTWDIEFVGTKLIVREGSGDIRMELQFTPPNRIDVVRGRFSRNGHEIWVRPDILCHANKGAVASNCRIEASVGVAVGDLSGLAGVAVHFPDENRGKIDKAEVEGAIREVREIAKDPMAYFLKRHGMSE